MKLKEKMKKLLSAMPKSKGMLLAAIGVLGLLLVLVSTIIPVGKSDKKQETEAAASLTGGTQNEYTATLEAKLEKLISDMLGGGRVSVMITLESGSEYVYADEVKTDADTKNDRSALKTEQSDSKQKSYVVVKDSDGNEKALVVTEKMPVIRGVVIVCDGGQTASVSAALKVAVTSALGVGEDKICIIGRYS